MPKRILLIDAIATHRIRFAALLEAARYQVETVGDLADLAVELESFDAVLIGLPNEQPARTIGEITKAMQGFSTPLLCIDSKPSPLRRVVALRAGARDILPANAPDDLVLALVRNLIRRGEAEREAERRRVTAASFGFSDVNVSYTHRARILYIGALGQLPDRLSALLPHEVVSISESGDCRESIAFHQPDAIVVCTGEDLSSLHRILPEVRDETHLSPVPVMAVYPELFPHLATDALALGASETVVDTAGLEEFEYRITDMLACKAQDDALRRSNEQSYRLAATDPLTGLYNRRYAEAYLARLPLSSANDGTEYSVVLIDLDHFKALNDTYGHAAGDFVLCEVAKRLRDNLRACDLVARYGGEEFLVVLPETTCATAVLLAERIRNALAARSVTISADQEIHVTASIGVAGALPEKRADAKPKSAFVGSANFALHPFRAVFEAADAALYRAKSAGRDRVEVSAA